MTGSEMKEKRMEIDEMTQKDLGFALGLSERTISRYETKESIPKWLAVAMHGLAFNTSVRKSICGF